MFHPGLAFAAACGLVATATFAYVGRRQLARSRAAGWGVALLCFTMWWWGLACSSFLIGCVTNALAAFGFTPLALFTALRLGGVLGIAVGIGGLWSYVLFLYTGRHVAVAWGTFAGSVVAATTIAIFAGYQVTSVELRAFATQMVFTPPLPMWARAMQILVFEVPQVLAALGLLTLLPKVDRAARWRLMLLGLAILVWSTSLAAAAFTDNAVAQLATRPLLGTLAAFVALYAYEPPQWARERFGVTAV